MRRWLVGSGCLIVVLVGAVGCVILGGIGIGIAAVVAPNSLNGLVGGVFGVEVIQSRPVAGDPARFDPIGSFESMRAFAGEGALLVGFRADYVRSDGTLDLTATYTPSPRVKAELLLKVARPADAPPVGAGGLGTWYRRVTIEAYRPGQGGRVSTRGSGGSFTYSYVNDGMTRRAYDPAAERDVVVLEAPRCAFKELWRVALERGAPADAVAVIEYGKQGYDFSIRDLRLNLEFDHACQAR